MIYEFNYLDLFEPKFNNMKKTILLIIAIISEIFCLGQIEEFNISSDELLYDNETMIQLGHIVDSLNIKFKKCEFDKTYYSKYQAKAHFLTLSKGKIKEAIKDMENDMPFKDFVKKYRKSEFQKELLVIKYNYKNRNEKDVVEFRSVIEENIFDFSENPDLYVRPMKSRWVFQNYKNFIRGFYFITEFEKKPLTEHYSRMIQYTDCMIDTNTQIFSANAHRTSYNGNSNISLAVEKFMSFVNSETNKPQNDIEDPRRYYDDMKAWYSSRVPILDSIYRNNNEFRETLNNAISDALINGGSCHEFEEYVGRYSSYEDKLELKRGRIVVGTCSMDSSPRYHAKDIAVLSAETSNWEIFLRAHLDIMNDFFARGSDGSYV